MTGLGYSVVRIGGADRYATASLIADQIAASAQRHPYLSATGLNFPDAESAADAAAVTNGVVLLTDGTASRRRPRQWRKRTPGHDHGRDRGSAAAADPSATPFVGTDRYATAAKVAASVLPTPAGVVIATGASFPDGLAGAAYAAHFGWAMVLVAPGCNDPGRRPGQLSARGASTVKTLVTVGQTAAVPPATVSAVLSGLG